MAKTPGEDLFERYLRGHQLTWEYEPQSPSGKRPDYLINSSPVTICEVETLG